MRGNNGRTTPESGGQNIAEGIDEEAARRDTAAR
jgi:hypothetical protein